MRDRRFWGMEKLLPKAGDYAIITLPICRFCPYTRKSNNFFPAVRKLWFESRLKLQFLCLFRGGTVQKTQN